MNNFIITYYEQDTELSSESNTFNFTAQSLEKTLRIIVRNASEFETYPRFYLTIPTSLPKYKTYVMNSSTEIVDKINDLNATISVSININGNTNQASDFVNLPFGEINSIAGKTILANQEVTYVVKIKLNNSNVNPFINAFNLEVI